MNKSSSVGVDGLLGISCGSYEDGQASGRSLSCRCGRTSPVGMRLQFILRTGKDPANICTSNMHVLSAQAASRPFCVIGSARPAGRTVCRCEQNRQIGDASLRRRSLLIAPLIAYTLQGAAGIPKTTISTTTSFSILPVVLHKHCYDLHGTESILSQSQRHHLSRSY